MSSSRTKLILFWLGLSAATCGSVTKDDGFSAKDGGFYTEDAVILNGEIRIPNYLYPKLEL